MMRYPGGKLRLMKKINQLIIDTYPESKNGWIVGEPFTGGGGSLINMAEEFPNWKFHINDLNVDVYDFWNFFSYAKQGDMDSLYDKIEKTKPTLGLYNQIFNSHPTGFDAAFRILFLNKTSFGGYITQNLPIGGKKQANKWKVDEYWTPDNFIKKIKRAKKAIDGRIISVTNIDCVKFVEKFNNVDFVYADPPYILYGKQWYNCNFDINSLKVFRKVLDSIPRWCVSMELSDDTKEIFKNDNIQYVNIKHTAQSLNKKKLDVRQELVVFKNA